MGMKAWASDHDLGTQYAGLNIISVMRMPTWLTNKPIPLTWSALTMKSMSASVCQLCSSSWAAGPGACAQALWWWCHSLAEAGAGASTSLRCSAAPGRREKRLVRHVDFSDVDRHAGTPAGPRACTRQVSGDIPLHSCKIHRTPQTPGCSFQRLLCTSRSSSPVSRNCTASQICAPAAATKSARRAPRYMVDLIDGPVPRMLETPVSSHARVTTEMALHKGIAIDNSYVFP